LADSDIRFREVGVSLQPVLHGRPGHAEPGRDDRDADLFVISG
jgi:hypothetical protein